MGARQRNKRQRHGLKDRRRRFRVGALTGVVVVSTATICIGALAVHRPVPDDHGSAAGASPSLQRQQRFTGGQVHSSQGAGGELGEVAAAAGDIVPRYDHDPSRVDGLLAVKTATGKHYAITDADGTVHRLVDDEGETTYKATVDAFGARTVEVDAASMPWGFQGRRHDPTGLSYHRARYYDPETGRFQSVDPLIHRPLAGELRLTTALQYVNVGVGGAVNGYMFADNNPITNSDPSGLITIKTGAGSRRSKANPAARYYGAPEEDLDTLEASIRLAVQAIAFRPDCQKAFAEAKSGNADCPNDHGRAAAEIFNRVHVWKVNQYKAGLLGRYEPRTSPPIIAYTNLAVGIGKYALAGTSILHEMAHHYVGDGHGPARHLNPYVLQERCGYPRLNWNDL